MNSIDSVEAAFQQETSVPVTADIADAFPKAPPITDPEHSGDSIMSGGDIETEQTGRTERLLIDSVNAEQIILRQVLTDQHGNDSVLSRFPVSRSAVEAALKYIQTTA